MRERSSRRGRDQGVGGAPVFAVEVAPPQRSDQHQREDDADQPLAFDLGAEALAPIAIAMTDSPSAMRMMPP
jgi:hypothetical protein